MSTTSDQIFEYKHIFDVEVHKREYSRPIKPVDKNSLKQCQSLCWQMNYDINNISNVGNLSTESHSTIAKKLKTIKWDRIGMTEKWNMIKTYLNQIHKEEYVDDIRNMLFENKLKNVTIIVCNESGELVITKLGVYDI